MKIEMDHNVCKTLMYLIVWTAAVLLSIFVPNVAIGAIVVAASITVFSM